MSQWEGGGRVVVGRKSPQLQGRHKSKLQVIRASVGLAEGRELSQAEDAVCHSEPKFVFPLLAKLEKWDPPKWDKSQLQVVNSKNQVPSSCVSETQNKLSYSLAYETSKVSSACGNTSKPLSVTCNHVQSLTVSLVSAVLSQPLAGYTHCFPDEPLSMPPLLIHPNTQLLYSTDYMLFLVSQFEYAMSPHSLIW